MALSFPLTTLVAPGVYASGFLRLRVRQERSITAGGRSIGRDLGPALWVGSFQTRPYPTAQAREIEARLHALDGVIRTFRAYDVRQSRPATAAASFDDTGVTLNGAPTASAVSLAGLPAGFVVTPGDHLAFDYGAGPSRALHQAVEGATADGSGDTPAFEVRPYVRPGALGGAAVTLVRPWGVFALDPDGVGEPQQVQVGLYTIGFTATQVI